MTLTMSLAMVILLMAVVMLASNPSPIYGALAVVLFSGMSAGMLVFHDSQFLSLSLFLIYLGGMMVVFAYSAALSCEPYRNSLVDVNVFVRYLFLSGVLVLVGKVFSKDWHGFSWTPSSEVETFCMGRGDIPGVSAMFDSGGFMLCITALVLLLTLFVVLALSKGRSQGAVRAI